MKKCLSILMAVILVFSCITTSVFAESAEITTEIAAEETISAEEKELIEIEEKKHRQEVQEEFESLNQALRSENKNSSEDEGGMSLFAADYTVSGTVSLSSGVTSSSGDIIRVYAYKPVELYNGFVVGASSNSADATATITLNEGKTSGTYSMSLPAGEYIFAVRYLSGDRNISGKMMFYTADGMTANEYAADAVTVSKATTVNLSLPKAESYVSGTIDLSENIPAIDTYIGINVSTNDRKLRLNQYVRVPVNAGDTSVDYEIGVDKAYLSLYISSDYFESGYYISGTIKSDYQFRTMLDATEPVENLDFVIPAPSSGVVFEECDITINFAKPITESKTFLVAFTDETGEIYDSVWLDVSAGDTSVSASLMPRNIDNLLFMYKDITGFDSTSWELDESCRFYSSELGYTSDVTKAANVSGMTSITVNEPESVTVSGSISTATGDTVRNYVYAGVEFETEVFYTRVKVSDGTYTVNVPKRLLNEEFRAFSAGGTYGVLDAETKIYNDDTYTLTGNLTNVNISAGAFRTISGTIYLPFAAPAAGMNIYLTYESNYNYADIGTLVVPSGAESVSYSVSIPENVPEDGYLRAQIEAFEKVNLPSEAISESLTANEDIYFVEALPVTGMISLPDGIVYDEDISMRVIASGDVYEYCYVSIPAGKTSATYEITYAKNAAIRSLYVEMETEGLELFDRVYYTNSGGTSSSNVNINLSVTESFTANFTLIKASLVKGTISLPSSVAYNGGEVGYRIVCKDVNTNQSYEKTYWIYTPYDENEFSIAVSSDESAQYILSVYVYNVGNSDILEYSYSYYVSDTEMSPYEASAAYVSAGNSYKLSFPAGASVSGTISFADGCYVKEGYLYGYVYAAAVSSGESYSYRIDNFTDMSDINYKISVPDNSLETYIVSVRIYNYNCEMTNVADEEYYYSSEGATLSEESATPVSQGTKADIKIPKMRSVSGKIIVPDDYKSIAPMGKVTAYFYSENGGYKSTDAYIDENLNYEAYITDEIVGSYYIQMTLGDTAVNNIIRGSYTNSTNADGTKAYFNIPEGEDVSGINISANTGWAVSGQIILPDDAVLEYTEFTPTVYFGYNSRSCAYRLSSTTRSIDYMIGVDKTNSNNYIGASCSSRSSSSGDWYSNTYQGNVYHVNNTTSVTDASSALKFNLTGDISDIDILLQTGAAVKVEATKPDGVTNYISLNLYFVDENGTQIDNESLYISSNETVGTENITLNKSFIGEKVYMYYQINKYYQSDVLYNYILYVNPDGTFAHSRAQATPFVIKEDQTISFELAGSDIETPEYVLESAHPYENNFEETYTYEHTDATAQQLYITFSENTYLASGDYIYIYDMNGKQVGYSYSYGNLAGKTITVSGNGFKLKFVTNGSGTDYGFAVESVVSELTHTVTFKDYDGTVLGTQTVEHGGHASYEGAAPTRADDDMYTYSFNGWNGQVYNITSDVTLVAKYNAYEKYVISVTALASGGYEYSVFNNTSNEVSGIVVVASYDADGKLIQAITEDIELDSSVTGNCGVEMAEEGTIKVMFWTSAGALKPLAKSYWIDY